LLLDQDDPEKRVAALEHQLAEARGAGNPPGGQLTPEHVRNVAFSKPRRGRLGNDEDEVDSVAPARPTR
jgi:hypothetical protein